jgi:hypothetical protein
MLQIISSLNHNLIYVLCLNDLRSTMQTQLDLAKPSRIWYLYCNPSKNPQRQHTWWSHIETTMFSVSLSTPIGIIFGLNNLQHKREELIWHALNKHLSVQLNLKYAELCFWFLSRTVQISLHCSERNFFSVDYETKHVGICLSATTSTVTYVRKRKCPWRI